MTSIGRTDGLIRAEKGSVVIKNRIITFYEELGRWAGIGPRWEGQKHRKKKDWALGRVR